MLALLILMLLVLYLLWYIIGGGAMATAEQLEMLIKAHFSDKDEQFRTAVLQIAAYEAQQGHQKLARKLKEYLDKATKPKCRVVNFNSANELFAYTATNLKINDLIVNSELQKRIQRILQEFRQRDKLNHYGLVNRRKILLEGNPGTGKTMTAKVIASELGLPLYTIQMDKLVTKYLGETSLKLRQIFENIDNVLGVYLFDEFDAIGADRSLDSDVGEMRRVLNSFLQFIEQDASDSIIIAATNNRKMLDQALFRRFDDVLHYSLPTRNEIFLLMKHKLVNSPIQIDISKSIIEAASTLSHAEITQACEDFIKMSILCNEQVNEATLINMLNDRVNAYDKEA
jgi:AAA+ superfamily predicted ATPase